MGRYQEFGELETSALGASNAGGDIFVQLGLIYASGRVVPADRVEAHKWFNLGAMRGHKEAVRLRREISEEMNEYEVSAAQKAAREWLRTH